MNEIQSGSKDLLDTTDSLEAVGVFKGWKNFFFVIMFICLLLQQASFWLVDRGCIALSGEAKVQTQADEAQVDTGETEAGEVLPPEEASQTGEPSGPAMVEPNLPEPKPLEADQPEPSVNQRQENPSKAEPNDVSGFSSFDSRIQHAVAWPTGEFLSGVTFEKLASLIRFLNAMLIFAGTLYCLTLFFGLKVSMHGRLGGINHISRAFFLSLILLVLLLPWQIVFTNMVTGAIFTADELAQWCTKETENIFDLVLYYMRFACFGALILLLLIFSQIRSVRWAKAILRRLEII